MTTELTVKDAPTGAAEQQQGQTTGATDVVVVTATPAPTFTTEQQAHIDRLVSDRLKREREKQQAAVDKAKADVEAAHAAERGEYKSLYEAVKPKADAADALQERLDAITAQAQAANEGRIAAIPDGMKSLVPEYDDPLKLAAWLDANAAVFSRPTPPPLDGRAGGNGTPAMVTDEEANEYAARWGFDPRHIDRAMLAKVIKR